MYNQYNIVADHAHIPQQAFLFVPQRSLSIKQRDDYRIGQGKNIRRLLFQGWAQQTYTPYQLQKLKQFDDYIQRKKIVLDARWDISWRMRWLLSTGCNIKKTIQDMQIYISYQNNLKNITLTNLLYQRLSKGVCYLGGRDCHYRPILVTDVDKMVKLDLKQQQMIQCITYFFQYVMKNYLIPGQVQNWISIIDCGFTGLMSLLGTVKKPIQFLSNTYRSRMFVCYVVQIPSSISFAWGIAKRFIQQQTVRKINFFDQSIIEPLLQYCNPSQLQQKFGGTLKNIENYWPPKQVSPDYKCTKQSVKLLTKEQYTKYYKSKTLYNTKFHVQNIIQSNDKTGNKGLMLQDKNTPILKKLQKQMKLHLQVCQQETVNYQSKIKPFSQMKAVMNYKDMIEKNATRNAIKQQIK